MDNTEDDLPPEIGPHEERELELMLAGQKPMAMFSDVVHAPFDWGEASFEPFVEDGRLIKREEIVEIHHPETHLHRYIYYTLPGEEWRSERLSQIHHHLFIDRVKTTPELETEIGRLLGYTDHEIAVYIERSSILRPWEK